MLWAPAYYKNISVRRLINHFFWATVFYRQARLTNVSLDLVITSSPPLYATNRALHIARQRNAKVITDIQDLWPEAFAVAFPPAARQLGMALLQPLKALEDANFRQADRLIAISQTLLGRAFAMTPHTAFERQGDGPLDQRQDVAAKHVQETGQQGIGHATRGTAHSHNAHLEPVGDRVYPAEVAAPQDGAVCATTVRATLRAHGDEPDCKAFARLVVLHRTGEVAYDGHGGKMTVWLGDPHIMGREGKQSSGGQRTTCRGDQSVWPTESESSRVARKVPFLIKQRGR